MIYINKKFGNWLYKIINEISEIGYSLTNSCVYFTYRGKVCFAPQFSQKNKMHLLEFLIMLIEK